MVQEFNTLTAEEKVLYKQKLKKEDMPLIHKTLKLGTIGFVRTTCQEFEFQHINKPYNLVLHSCKDILIEETFWEENPRNPRGIGYKIDLQKLCKFIVENDNQDLDFFTVDFII